MKIGYRREGPITIVTASGVVKIRESGDSFSEILGKTLHEEKGPVLVDLSGVDALDSTGLGEMVAYLRKFRLQGRSFAILASAPRIRKLLEFTNLDRTLPVYHSRDEALQSMTDEQSAKNDTLTRLDRNDIGLDTVPDPFT
ncbi:MAG: STAS domain-containing protein [Chitinivibrionales bacterium]|nr:STAS domain-containing protein [Chitinivibrionales bacterium]MBD3356070.1 STAS domain-containing protein [Chitinivibrionales bacterium]